MSGIRVLISDLPLPFEGIGSWTNEVNFFLERNKGFFDFIISPNQIVGSKTNIFARKRSWIPGLNKFRNQLLVKWVAKDYIQAIEKLVKENRPIQLVVIDDKTLLEAISLYKNQLPAGSTLIFYFHGHLLQMSSAIQSKVDLVLFLTKIGYKESFLSNLQFTPEVKVIGNGVSSGIFYPLTKSQKKEYKEQLGFQPEDKFICWMANSRPVKGIHLFGKMIPKLLSIDPSLKIITIGHEPIKDWESDSVFQLGKLNPSDLAKYLQVSDFYFFTSLWKEGFGLSLVEAIKCGNYILCSETGGIPEVVGSISRVRTIENPNIIENWIDKFEEIFLSGEYLKESDSIDHLEELYSLESWENRFKNALL